MELYYFSAFAKKDQSSRAAVVRDVTRGQGSDGGDAQRELGTTVQVLVLVSGNHGESY